MPPNSKKSKKKTRSKQGVKKGGSSEVQARLCDQTNEYPTSRVIKRAPNGDVIVESLATDEEYEEDAKGSQQMDSPMAFTLDSHWESLGPEAKKSILRIEKDEVFEVIRNYQNSHNCNCSVCGRRHMAMDQEMERMYNTLYDLDRERDPEINPIKFHLSIIKELQNSKAQQHQETSPREPNGVEGVEDQDVDEPGNMRDDVVKYFLSSNAVDSLKEEVMHFKQNKQQQQALSGHADELESDEFPTTPMEQTMDSNIIRSPPKSEASETALSEAEQSVVPADDDELQAKYLKFAKTFVSSHPKIAKEYVSRMMMYPDMRALTDDLMNNNGQGFVKSIENFVAQKQHSKGQAQDQLSTPNCLEGFVEAANMNVQSLGDAKEFTTMLHNGKPLTSEEYANLQRHVADRMTNSYDAQKKEFKEVSQLERELFTRFMFGEDRKRFGDLIMQSFREKFDDQYGNAAIGASLAAAAATTVSPMEMPGHDEINEDFEQGENDEDDEELDSNEYDESYDDYSDYGDEEEIAQGDEDDDIRSDFGEEEEEELTAEDERDHHYCAHNNRVNQQNNCHGHKNRVQEDEVPQGQRKSHYHPHHEHDEDFDEENDNYESSLDEADRLEEGRKLIQIAITKLLQGRIMESYHEKEAENNRLKLLQELEAEELKKKAKEEKKHKKREKEKEKKKAQQIAKEEEKRRKEEESEMMKKEAEEREKQRREAQRKKVEEAKRKKDEERRQKLEEQRRREEEQERHRKVKEEQKRKRDAEKRLKDEERKRIEESKRLEEERQQREEEMKIQEQARQKAEEDERVQRERFTEEQNAYLKRQIGQTMDSTFEPTSSQKTLFTPLQYSTPSPNIPYGNPAQSIPSYRPSNVNDNIMNMASSATTAKQAPPSSGLQNLFEVGSGIPRDVGAQQRVPNGAQLYGPSSLMQNYPGENLPYNNTSCLLQPASSSQNSISSGLGGQNLGLSSWNSFERNSNSLRNFQQTPLDMQREHRQRSSSSFGTNHTQPVGEEYLAEEMNNIAHMLSSAGLEDPSTTARANSFGHNALWGGNGDSSSVSISNRLVPGNGQAPGMNVDPNPPSGSNPPKVPLMGNAVQHSSIWHRGGNNAVPGVPGETTPIATKASSAAYAPSIWGPSNMSFLNEGSDMSNPTDAQSNGRNERVSTEGGLENKDSLFVESIYKTYLAFIPPGSKDYVPTNTIHQNSLCCTLDYPSFISCLLSMQATHDCDLLRGPAGTITHVRMAGPSTDATNSSSRRSVDSMMNGIYFNQSEAPMPAPLNELPPSSAASSALGNGDFGPQYYNLPHSINHSSLTGNIWS